jgi:hypothetical protein
MGQTLNSDYYLIFINPSIHKINWKCLNIITTYAEIKYSIFVDYKITKPELRPVTKHEFKKYQYNPN